MINISPYLLIHLLLLSVMTSVCMADVEDPLADDPLAEQLIDIDESFERFEFFGDAQLRGDVVRDLPRMIEPEFQRMTSRIRAGAIMGVTDSIEIGLAAKINLSSQANSETRFNLDNERADDITVDQLFARFDVTENSSVLIGQSVFPLRLSPMLWDSDLRPQGISFQYNQSVGDFSSFELTGGTFLGNHLFGDSSRINAVQAGLNIGEGTSFGYNAAIAYLDFDNLGDLARNDLRRTNSSVAGGGFAEEFKLIDVKLGTNIRWNNFPIRAGVDLVKNVAASDDNIGGRVDVVFGKSIGQRGIELGLVAQRIQQDAVVAPFNDDDWWFATNMRGVGGWLAYGFSESIRAKVTVFHERLDTAENNNNRALFDLQYFF